MTTFHLTEAEEAYFNNLSAMIRQSFPSVGEGDQTRPPTPEQVLPRVEPNMPGEFVFCSLFVLVSYRECILQW